MVTRFLILILAVCLRAFVAHALSFPLTAKISERLPITPQWACEILAIFAAVVIVETIGTLAEHLVRRWRHRDSDEAGRDGLA